MNERRIIAFDLETTGLYPESGDMILEIAALPIINDKIIEAEAFNSLVNPEKEILPHITMINHITNEMVKDAPLIEEVLPSFLNYLQNYTLVAHNAPFDIGFLQYFIKKLGLRELQNRIIDTVILSKKLFSGSKYHNMDAVLKRLGISYDKEKRHRSIGDAYLTALSFIKMKRIANFEF